MTLAQKKARENFKKAIAYRKKTGCSLKQAFAHVKKGKKVGATKVIERGEKKNAKVTKVLQRVRSKKGTFKGMKKVSGGTHKDTKSHNVNIRVVSGINYNDPILIMKEIEFWQKQLDKLRSEYKSPERKMYKSSIMSDIRLSKKWLENYKKKLKLIISKIK
jgi:hypothetical protein